MTLKIGSGNDNLNHMHLGLERMERLLEYLGNPQEAFFKVHVAGTNGKGAVVAFLRQICVEAGLSVGSFQSPAVWDELEVIRMGDTPISRDNHERLCEKLSQAVDSLRLETPDFMPSAFELQTVEAFCYFAEQQADLVLLETGLGGDADATNAYQSGQLCSIITPVGLDHCQFLGDTVEEIAAHKAGILRAGCPVVLGRQSLAVQSVLKDQAGKLGCPVMEPQWDTLHISKYSKADGKISFEYGDAPWICGLSGLFQVDNAVCAVETVEQVLRPAGFEISQEALRKGLLHVSWPGRFEILPMGTEKYVVLDGAHNPPAARRLAESVQTYFGSHHRLFVCGVLADKDFMQVFNEMQSVMQQAKVWTVTPPMTRGLSSVALKEALEDIGLQAENAASVECAASQAMQWLDHWEEPAVVIGFGSLSWLADFRKTLEKERQVEKRHG